jgi:hypothetical protein
MGSGLKMWWCHHLCMLVLNLATWAPRGSHVNATQQPRQCHPTATSVPPDRHVSATRPPRQRHVAAMSASRGCHISDTFLKHHRHVICHIIATSSLRVMWQVMWQVNSWRPLSSQILGFGLGSMGFAPIYDGLRTSWITLIYDENLRTSR